MPSLEPQPTKPSLVSKLALLFLSIGLALILLEIFLRVFVPRNPFSPHFPLYPHERHTLHTSYAGVSPIGMHSTNRWGFRGDEPPMDWKNAYTIITVGGSTTHCYYLDDHKTWPYLLQQDLKPSFPKIWVGNAGIDGQTTRAHIMLMDEIVSKIRPRMVIFLVGINDLGLSIREDRKDLGIAADRPHSRRWDLFTHSALLQLLYAWKQILWDHAPVALSGGSWERKPLTHPMLLPKDLRTLLPLRDEYAHNIRTLIAQCRALGIHPVFLTQPMLFDNTPPWQKLEGTFYWIAHTKGQMSAATYWKLLEIYNHILLDTCRQEHVDAYDLASVIPHEEKYYTDAVHYTEAGADLIAQRVAAYLIQNHKID